MKCHAAQGYEVGDVRGGISVSIPMTPLQTVARVRERWLLGIHGGFWLLGLLGLFVAVRRLVAQDRERARAELRLQESEHKFRTLFQSSSDAVMMLRDGRFFDCNDATLEIFGAGTRAEFLDRHPGSLSPPTQPDGKASSELADELMAEAIREGRSFFEWRHRRLDDEEFCAEVLRAARGDQGADELPLVANDDCRLSSLIN